VRSEHGELLRDVPGPAIGTRRRRVAEPDELLEVALALHADVLVNRHRPQSTIARRCRCTRLSPPQRSREQVRWIRELTDRPFIVSHTARPLSEEEFAVTLEERPPAISYALGDPGELVSRAHDAGIRFLQQVHTVEQAERAADRGVDAVIAQGSEAGGFGGDVVALALVPQVVDAVTPVPVLAAGGIADGRGLAAALLLDAQGVNLGTRFLAADESRIAEGWKRRILEATSQDAVRVEFADAVFPPATGEGYGTRPRVLRTPFVDEWNARREEIGAEAARLSAELVASVRENRAHELVPFTGQTAGMIRDVLPAAEIVGRLVSEEEAALRSAPGLAG
jgi:nitronate monooxygenase/enoyl-[acyl-carrier protein] reductase II